MELGNILYHFAKQGCKKVTLKLDNLRYNYKKCSKHFPAMEIDIDDVLAQFIGAVEVKEQVTER